MLEAPNPNAEFHMPPQIQPIPKTGSRFLDIVRFHAMPYNSGRANERTGKASKQAGSAYLKNIDLPRPQSVYGNMEISDSSIWM